MESRLIVSQRPGTHRSAASPPAAPSPPAATLPPPRRQRDELAPPHVEPPPPESVHRPTARRRVAGESYRRTCVLNTRRLLPARLSPNWGCQHDSHRGLAIEAL